MRQGFAGKRANAERVFRENRSDTEMLWFFSAEGSAGRMLYAERLCGKTHIEC